MKSATGLVVGRNKFSCTNGELLVIQSTLTEASSRTELNVSLTPAPIDIQEVHILGGSNGRVTVVSCNDLVDITPDTIIRNLDGNGLYVLVEQESQPQALYRLDKGSSGGPDNRAGVLRMRFEFDFTENTKINDERLSALPEVLNNLAAFGNTVITIAADSSDSRTNNQLVAAAALLHHRQKLSKEG